VIDITRVRQTRVLRTATGCCERNVAYFRPFKSGRTPPRDGYDFPAAHWSCIIHNRSSPFLASLRINRAVHTDLGRRLLSSKQILGSL